MVHECNLLRNIFSEISFSCSQLKNYNGVPVIIDQGVSFNNNPISIKQGEKFLRIKIEMYKPKEQQVVQPCDKVECQTQLKKFFEKEKEARKVTLQQALHLKRKKESMVDKIDGESFSILIRPVCASDHHNVPFFYFLTELLDESDKVVFRGSFVSKVRANISGSAGKINCEIPLEAVK